MKNTKYLEAVKNLTEAATIAINAFNEYPPKIWNEGQLKHVINVYTDWIEEITNPKPQYANMASLKYSVDSVFTYFQESGSQEVDYFWQKIKEADLPYKRENKMAKILKRKRIKDDIEYNFVIDVLTPYHQEGLITEEELVLLNQWIGDFENKTKN